MAMNESDKALIMAYLYHSLSDQEVERFETRLKQDVTFRSLFEEHQLFDEIVKPGVAAKVSEQRMSSVNWSLGIQLRQQSEQQLKQNYKAPQSMSPMAALTALWQSRVSFKTQLASIVVAFLLGVFLVNGSFVAKDSHSIATEYANKAEALRRIQNEDYQIIDLQISNSNSQNDNVRVTYSLVSKTQFEDQLSSIQLQQLLSATIKSDVNDTTRLNLIDALKEYVNSDTVREAFSYSLLNDPNPGVRLIAVQSLAKLSDQKPIRDVLALALSNDSNSGIRVQAFNALNSYIDDPEMIKVLKNSASNDSNLYIRNSAKSILRNLQKQKSPQT